MNQRSSVEGIASLPWVHPGNWSDQYGGLTKREYFAAMALQGILASGNDACAPNLCVDNAHWAVANADALLEALK